VNHRFTIPISPFLWLVTINLHGWLIATSPKTGYDSAERPWLTYLPKTQSPIKGRQHKPRKPSKADPCALSKNQISHKISWSIMIFPLRLLLCFLVGGDRGQKKYIYINIPKLGNARNPKHVHVFPLFLRKWSNNFDHRSMIIYPHPNYDWPKINSTQKIPNLA
jgi:hypothetical protein